MCFRFILFANNPDDLIKIEIGNQITVQNFKPCFDFIKAKTAFSHQNFFPVIKPFK